MIARVRQALSRRRQRPRPSSAVDWRQTIRRRLTVAAVGLVLWVVGIESRLVYLQVIAHADLEARAERQQMRTIERAAKRGDILDRQGHVLATSADVDSIYAVPSAIGDEAATVARLCAAFGDCKADERQTLIERLGRKRHFEWVRRQISPDDARKVAALDLEGIGFLKESRRFYPGKELAAHLLGWVGIDNNGLSGLEFAYDSQIRGKAGRVLVQIDARRHAFSRFEQPPTAGSSIELTVDQYLQHVAERELRAGVRENRASAGTAIILDPHTGEILAMANDPTFNPNAYRDARENDRRNRAVQDLYEPGSTFKVVTASAAIEEHVMPVDALIDTSPGIIRIGNSVVDEYRGHNYGVLSFRDVIVKSSNIGAIKIGFRVGTTRMSEYLQRFGFGRPVSPDFPGESPGIVWSPDKWTERALASVSMGYQVGVTALQMASAVSSIANGGELVEPRVLRAIYRDDRRYAVKPKVLRRTVSPATVSTLTTIMEGVVEEGTAKLAQIPGYTIAGKTGTASKLVNGRYSAFENNVSFVGFVPSRAPAITIIVMIDTPRAGGNSGGVVAAPIFKRIAEATLRYLRIGPTVSPDPPLLVSRSPESAPVPTAATDPAPAVSVVTEVAPGTMPDLRGLSAREASRRLVQLGLTARLSGSGFVVSQEPMAGTPLEEGAVCRLVLDRTLPTVSASASAPEASAQP